MIDLPDLRSLLYELWRKMHPAILVMLHKYSVDERGSLTVKCRRLLRRLNEIQASTKPELDLWLEQQRELQRLHTFLSLTDVEKLVEAQLRGANIWGEHANNETSKTI